MKYINRIKDSIFTKITIVYGAVILFMVPLFTSFVSIKVESELKQRWEMQNQTVMQIMSNYFSNKITLSYKVYESLFADKELFNQIVLLLKEEQECGEMDAFERKELVDGLDNLIAFDDEIVMVSFFRASSEDFFTYETFSKTVRERINHSKSLGEIRNKDDHRNFFTYDYPRWDKNLKCLGITYNFSEVGSNRPLGKIMISYDIEKIRDIVNEYLELLNGQILLLKDDGSVIFDSDSDYYGMQYPFYEQIRDKDHFANDEEYSVSKTRLAEANLTLYSITPSEQIIINARTLQSLTFTLCFSSLLIILVLYAVFSKIFSRRVGGVIKTMENINAGKMESRIQIKGNSNDEITRISNSFNNMCDKLLKNMENLLETRERQKYAELEALQMKMDPHFIYNSLEIIRIRCEEYGNEDIAEILQTFSELFRETIRSGPICTIREEIETVRIYTDILEMCYSDILLVQYNMDEKILDYGIIKKIIQPIVENYFVHGFDKSRENNKIQIEGFLSGKNIVFRIIDNGKGIDREKVIQINRQLQNSDVGMKTYIGLGNANSRIRILFGNSCGLKIESEEGRGTVVTVTIHACTKQEVEAQYQYKQQS